MSENKVTDFDDLSDKKNILTASEICKSILKKMDEMTIDNFNPDKEYLSRYSFVTKNSCDIKIDLIKKAELLLSTKRENSRNMILKFVKELFIADDIEKGIFEFSLIQVVINKLQNHFVENIYANKLSDICINLDPSNPCIQNKTFLPTVTGGKFRPFFAAFLSPEQMHPQRWSDIMEKQKIKEEAINNLSTTDMYKCAKCGERKMKITRLQLRSADEPESLFAVCLVCYHTFIK